MEGEKKMKAIAIILFVIVTACSYNPKTTDTYKILLGKKCTPDSKKFSYIWFHTVYGEKQVKKEWCK
jgi:hypothetical protein